jgi:hypothetical protein
MSKPITSRIKRSPLFKYSPLKQDTPATTGGTEEGEESTKTVTTTTEDPNLSEFNKRCGKFKGKNSKEAKLAGCEWKAGVKDPEPITTTEEVTVKGDDLDYDTTLMQSNEGTIAEPWQQAKMLSNIKRSGRNVRKAQNKKNKADRKDKKYLKKYDTDNSGDLSDEEKSKMKKGFLGFGNEQKSFERNKSRQTENTRELKMFEDDQKNTGLGVASGGVQGDKYKKADTVVTTGQRTEEQQKAEAKRLAKKKAKEDAAAAQAAKDKAALDAAKNVADEENQQIEADANGVTTGQAQYAIGANDMAPISLGGGFGAGLDLYKQSSYGPLAMTKKGYSMKAKSPATKKLQGAQNTLPPHLQTAIKGAPGKMRSSLKKSYFKNK